MKRWTIRVRLTVLYGGLFLLAGALLLAVTYLLVKQSYEARMGPGPASIDFRPVPGTAPGMPPRVIRLPGGQEVSLSEAAEAIRAEREQFRQDALDSLLTQGGIALAGVGIVAGAFGWLLAGRALQPVHTITETARRIAAAGSTGGTVRGLHERIALTGPQDEVKELADTFDSMLERLDRSFDGQRRFVANASHELRTPLAINRALIEVTVTRPGVSADTQQLGEALLTVNARHERLIDGLLTLAESENETTERNPVDLADVARHVLDHVAAPAAEASVMIHPGQLDPAPTTGDPVLLERLAQNLVENAVRHNHRGGWLAVTTQAGAGSATLVVTNTGPVVPPYEIESLFQPFRRRGGDRAGSERGLGLGLSIVRAVARAHGGEATASSHEGGGLIVQVTLPLS